MRVRHRGREPSIDPTAYVASTAVLVGDVRAGPGSRILHGAVLSAEDGFVSIGRDTVVMEQAVVRGRASHPAEIGSSVMVGPHAHVNGAVVADEVFVATGASLFPGSRIGAGAEVRINAVVHVNTVVPEGAVIPIGWVAVGDPHASCPPTATRRSGPSNADSTSSAPCTERARTPRCATSCDSCPTSTASTGTTES